MTIQKRIVTVKRHTVGYVIGGQEYTRLQAVKLTRQGKVSNARVVKTQQGQHIMGHGTALYELPIKFKKSAKRS